MERLAILKVLVEVSDMSAYATRLVVAGFVMALVASSLGSCGGPVNGDGGESTAHTSR